MRKLLPKNVRAGQPQRIGRNTAKRFSIGAKARPARRLRAEMHRARPTFGAETPI
jgi:hypothetical protein